MWMEVIKNYMKLLKLEERMWLIGMIGGEGSMYWIEYKLFYVLVHIADLKLIRIKACWFGLEMKKKKT